MQPKKTKITGKNKNYRKSNLAIAPIVLVIIIAAVVVVAGVVVYFTVLQPQVTLPTSTPTTSPQTTTPTGTSPQTTTPLTTTTPRTQTTTTPTTTQTGPPPQIELRRINTILDLVKIVEEVDYRYTNYRNGTQETTQIYAGKIGEENVGGTQTYVILVTINDYTGETFTYKAWVDKTTGMAVQLQMPDGSLLAGPFAATVWNGVVAVIIWPYTFLPENYYQWAVLGAFYQGYEWKDYGGTPLKVHKFYIDNPDNRTDYAEVWFAELPNQIGILAKFYVKSISGDWNSFELIYMYLEE